VTAALLLEQGWTVLGVHLLLADTPRQENDLSPLITFLGIECRCLDFRQEFRTAIIDDFMSRYRQGKTPNPCVRCNAMIKFGRLRQVVREWGYDYLATGHYARLGWAEDGSWALYRGVDTRKEQSYFLHRLPRAALDSILFPLGGFTKTQVRQMSVDLGLAPYIPSRESQELCFVSGNYVDFMQSLGEEGLECRGRIVNRQGTVLGAHRGLVHYTVGQRQGLGVPAAAPYYVLALDPETNVVVVGSKAELLAGGLEVEDLHWLRSVPTGPLPAQVRLRYRHPGVGCLVLPQPNNRVIVLLDEPQTAVAPGQAAVFYQGDRVLGGGWIVRGFAPGGAGNR
jgi:tRNA-uridine 2-sulfurtransferase